MSLKNTLKRKNVSQNKNSKKNGGMKNLGFKSRAAPSNTLALPAGYKDQYSTEMGLQQYQNQTTDQPKKTGYFQGVLNRGKALATGATRGADLAKLSGALNSEYNRQLKRNILYLASIPIQYLQLLINMLPLLVSSLSQMNPDGFNLLQQQMDNSPIEQVYGKINLINGQIDAVKERGVTGVNQYEDIEGIFFNNLDAAKKAGVTLDLSNSLGTQFQNTTIGSNISQGLSNVQQGISNGLSKAQQGVKNTRDAYNIYYQGSLEKQQRRNLEQLSKQQRRNIELEKQATQEGRIRSPFIKRSPSNTTLATYPTSVRPGYAETGIPGPRVQDGVQQKLGGKKYISNAKSSIKRKLNNKKKSFKRKN